MARKKKKKKGRRHGRSVGINKTCEAMSSGLHKIFGFVGFFYSPASAGDGVLHVVEGATDLVGAGGQALLGLGNEYILGDERAAQKRYDKASKDISSAKDHGVDALWDVAFLIPGSKVAKLCNSLIKLSSIAKRLEKLEKFNSKLQKTGGLGLEESKAYQKLLEDKMTKELGELSKFEKEIGEGLLDNPVLKDLLTFKDFRQKLSSLRKEDALGRISILVDVIQDLDGKILYLKNTFGGNMAGLISDDDIEEPDFLKNFDESKQLPESYELIEEEGYDDYDYEPPPSHDEEITEITEEDIQAAKNEKEAADKKAKAAEEKKKRAEKESKKAAKEEAKADKRVQDAAKREDAANERVVKYSERREFYEERAKEAKEKEMQAVIDNDRQARKKAQEEREENEQKAKEAARKEAIAREDARRAAEDRRKASEDAESAALSKSMSDAVAQQADMEKSNAESVSKQKAAWIP